MAETSIQAGMSIPGYEILSELGRGGVSTVYLARHQLLERKVAIKVMSPALTVEEGFSKRFIREGQTIARLEHPGIVRVYDVSVADYRPYIAMEYLPGGSLKDRMKTSIAADEALSILRSIADSLGYAHGLGVFHRDVKPDNILFRADDDPVLTDFGIAKSDSQDTALTSVGVVVGTPRYISPEQAQGHGTDARSDIYALGVILFEMLTGRPPYDVKGSMSLLYAHINDPIPRLPEELAIHQELVDDLLAKDPGRRVPDCETLVRRLDALCGGVDPTGATRRTPVPPVRRASPRWYARPYTRVWILSTVAVTLLLYLVWSRNDYLVPGYGVEADRDLKSSVTSLMEDQPGVSLDEESGPSEEVEIDQAAMEALFARAQALGDRDPAQAAELYRRAASAGHAPSQFHLGVAYGNGEGVGRDETRALDWLTRAASGKIPGAQYNLVLGRIFGPEADTAEAARVARELADDKYAPIYRILGWMYNTGTGVESSFTQSVKWSMKTMVGDWTGKSSGPDLVVERWESRLKTELDKIWKSEAPDDGR